MDPHSEPGLVIAIDGPSGSGKSTVAREVARRLGLRYLDTGATYRALAWQVLATGGDPTALAATTRIEPGTDPDAPTIAVDGQRVDAAIRSAEVTRAVSPVSAVPEVRRRLVALQRAVIGDGGIVVEGRDIGTVVATDAPIKVFLTASPAARAERRAAELDGGAVDAVEAARVDAVARDLERRDRIDSTRAASPLVRAPDAVAVDATALTADEVVEEVLGLVAARVGVAR